MAFLKILLYFQYLTLNITKHTSISQRYILVKLLVKLILMKVLLTCIVIKMHITVKTTQYISKQLLLLNCVLLYKLKQIAKCYSWWNWCDYIPLTSLLNSSHYKPINGSYFFVSPSLPSTLMSSETQRSHYMLSIRVLTGDNLCKTEGQDNPYSLCYEVLK